MLEKHPYKAFVPENARYLILGSFPAKQTERGNWYYVNPRNQFWSILEKVYNFKPDTIKKKKRLFKELNIAITDIIYSCKRKDKSNLDNNLISITYNLKGIKNILKEKDIRKIYCTSRFVENKFKKLFSKFIRNNQNIELIYLPSPSPKYASMKLTEKINIYKKMLPTNPC